MNLYSRKLQEKIIRNDNLEFERIIMFVGAKAVNRLTNYEGLARQTTNSIIPDEQ